jgi:hypothetical protein
VKRIPLSVQFILVTALVCGVLGAARLADRDLAARIVTENGPVEALQGLILSLAVLITVLRCRRLLAAGQSGVSEVVLAYGFMVLLTGELEIWRLLVGKTLMIRRIVNMQPALFIRAMLVLSVMVAVTVAVAVYALRHLKELWRWGLAALGTGWGRILVLGLLMFAGTEEFEGKLNRILPTVLPRNFLEEGLELLADAYFMLALFTREREDRGA